MLMLVAGGGRIAHELRTAASTIQVIDEFRLGAKEVMALRHTPLLIITYMWRDDEISLSGDIYSYWLLL